MLIQNQEKTFILIDIMIFLTMDGMVHMVSTTYKPSSRIVGLLYIDVIDAKTGSLLWQGNGSGSLSSNKLSRDELINNFVSKLMESYPSKNL